MKRTSITRTLADSLALDLLGESTPVIEDDGDIDPKTMVKYVTMPGTIDAIMRGEGTECVRHLPVGGIDQFKFVDMTDGNMLWNRDDSGRNDKAYEDFMKQYSDQKSATLKKWYADNKDTYEAVRRKYGNDIVGFDIVPNKSKVQNPEPKGEKEGGDKAAQAQEPVKEDEPQVKPEPDKAENDELPKKEITREGIKNTKIVAEYLSDKENQEDMADLFAEKVEKSGKEGEIDNKIQAIMIKVLGEDGYRNFIDGGGDEAKGANGKPDVMKWLQAQPRKVQSELLRELEALKDQDESISVGIRDIQEEAGNDKEDLEFVEAAKEIAQEKGENLDESLWTGIISTLSGLFNVAWGLLQVFFAHPLAMTGICALFYIAYKGKRGGHRW